MASLFLLFVAKAHRVALRAPIWSNGSAVQAVALAVTNNYWGPIQLAAADSSQRFNSSQLMTKPAVFRVRGKTTCLVEGLCATLFTFPNFLTFSWFTQTYSFLFPTHDIQKEYKRIKWNVFRSLQTAQRALFGRKKDTKIGNSLCDRRSAVGPASRGFPLSSPWPAGPPRANFSFWLGPATKLCSNIIYFEVKKSWVVIHCQNQGGRKHDIHCASLVDILDIRLMH